MNKKEIKKMANALSPKFNLGKQGVTSSFIESIVKYLKVQNIVKIKCLAATDKASLSYFANEVSKQTQSEIVDLKGFTFTLYLKD